MWNRFWKWYESKILGSIVIVGAIQYIQIPHMVWNADLYLEIGVIARIHPVLDFLLYGVDLLEIVSILNISMVIYSIVRNRRAK